MVDVGGIHPERFKLKWVRQGRVAWRTDWVNKYGPTRSHLPGLGEHISFANFDLKRNSLPMIELDSDGDPYVMAVRPLTEAEERETLGAMIDYFGLERANNVFRDKVVRPVVRLAMVLDLAAYHGFVPAEETPGLQRLRTLLRPKD